jgi:hypothetical protein
VEEIAPDDGDRDEVVTTGAKSAVRKKALARTTEAFSSSAAPSETAIESGTPTTTKYIVLPRAFQKRGDESRWA